MAWRNRTVDCAGSVVFRGTMPPRLKEFAAPLKAARVSGKAVPAGDNHWAADLSHPQWGQAKVICLRDMGRPPDVLIDFDPWLDGAERAAAKEGGSTVSVMITGGKRGDVLSDRKALLRWLRVFMADDGLVAMDHTSQRFWSRAALDDELSHDADLDVEALFTTHVVTGSVDDTDESAAAKGEDEEGPEHARWLHTHGLAEIGFFDFDVLNAHRSVASQGGFDALRVLAFGILEETAKPGMEQFELAGGAAGPVRLVDAKAFNRRASRADSALRGDADEDHNKNRVVVCDPRRGLLSRLFDRPRPCAWLQQEVGEGDLLIFFSHAATDLMAERARATWRKFRDWSAEMAEFECPVIVKLGYETDSPGGGKEHLWFSVDEARDASVVATLQSGPFDIAAMKQGDQAEHPLELLTDWAIITPIGMVTPRNTTPLRRVREHREQLREVMREAKAADADA